MFIVVDFRYVREVSHVRYGMQNYDDKVKYKFKAKDKSYRSIKKHLIISFEIHNIHYNSSF